MVLLDGPIFYAAYVYERCAVSVTAINGALGDAALLLSDHIIARELDPADPYPLRASGPAGELWAKVGDGMRG